MIPELITRPQADALMWIVLALGFVVGPFAAWWIRRKNGDGLAYGLIWGGPLVLAGVMWHVYNAITERLGLDSVLNLLVNLVLFVVLGAGCGLGWAFLIARRGTTAENPGEETPVS